MNNTTQPVTETPMYPKSLFEAAAVDAMFAAAMHGVPADQAAEFFTKLAAVVEVLSFATLPNEEAVQTIVQAVFPPDSSYAGADFEFGVL